jgi:hypothetical protein
MMRGNWAMRGSFKRFGHVGLEYWRTVNLLIPPLIIATRRRVVTR